MIVIYIITRLMENKTAIQKLALIIEDRIGVSTMADQSKEGIIGYQMALVGIKLELKKLLELEKEQIKKAYKDCHDLGHIYGLDTEEYYKETYANDTTKGLPEEDSKRRAWHY